MLISRPYPIFGTKSLRWFLYLDIYLSTREFAMFNLKNPKAELGVSVNIIRLSLGNSTTSFILMNPRPLVDKRNKFITA